MFDRFFHNFLLHIAGNGRPTALANIVGNAAYPNLNGTVSFYTVPNRGTVVEVEVHNLPNGMDGNPNAFFGFHIHENGDCSDSFQNTGNHYNPSGAAHPSHAGDMPPLMSNGGYAWAVFYDDRFTPAEILNRSVVIHRMPDDFTTQPAGDAGEKIGCGVIRFPG